LAFLATGGFNGAIYWFIWNGLGIYHALTAIAEQDKHLLIKLLGQ
jgi:hypothetical protein